jgi:hypothetical protein
MIRLLTLTSAAAISISLTVPPVRQATLLPNGKQVHIVCNTGEDLPPQVILNGVAYNLANCDLSPGKYIDTVCDLQPTN